MINGVPHFIAKKKVIWKQVVRANGTIAATPADENPVKRYVIYNPATKSGIYKEVGNDLARTFEDCKDIYELIERVHKL